jgi:hypothetical protein
MDYFYFSNNFNKLKELIRHPLSLSINEFQAFVCNAYFSYDTNVTNSLHFSKLFYYNLVDTKLYPEHSGG